MRPILVLAILLLGLKSAIPEPKFGNAADVKFQKANIQLAAADSDEIAFSPDVETTGSIIQLRVDQSRAAEPQTGSENKKSDQDFALLTPPVAGSVTAPDQDEEADAPVLAPPAAETDADADADDKMIDSLGGLCNVLLTSAQDNDLPVPFFANLIWQESRLQHDAVSRAGALGIAQFMPDVAVEVGLADPFDPRQAIPASARLLHVLREHFGNLGFAAAAYNAGAHRVGLWLDRRRRLPKETRTYVLRVTGRTAEAWRKSPIEDSKVRFERHLPCRNLPAFAELDQSQASEPQPDYDAKPSLAQPEKVATRVARLIVRKVAAKAAAKVAVKTVAKASPSIASGGSVANPLVVERSETSKPAGAAVIKVMARAGRHDALRRPQHATREKRHVA